MPEHAPQTAPMRPGRRMDERTQLMLRSAKVLCLSGEYFCTVRDVSSAGTGLRFLHEVPPEPRMLLELANGLTYPIERVWSGKRQAGYRFAAPVDLDEFVHEPSPYEARPVRLRIAADARIAFERQVFAAQLADISTVGAGFACDLQVPVGSLVGFEVPGIAPRLGHICWNRDRSFGMNFQRPLAIEELAEGALRLQPYAAPNRAPLRGMFARRRAA